MRALQDEIRANVNSALQEDIGSGDLTASLIPADKRLNAVVISRDRAILCGTQWFELCFLTLSPDTVIDWFVHDGELLHAGQKLCEIHGSARALLTAERSALNFLQLLSGVATQTRQFVDAIAGTQAAIVDTRKTLPGLRLAQKYAVTCGGGTNHRVGLYDGILIKENHILATGGIKQALEKARQLAPPNIFIQIEVESLEQLQEALVNDARMILLDNFTVAGLSDAVELARRYSANPITLEASGNISLENVHAVAKTGVDRISIGGLTKNVKAIDLSLRFDQ